MDKQLGIKSQWNTYLLYSLHERIKLPNLPNKLPSCKVVKKKKKKICTHLQNYSLESIEQWNVGELTAHGECRYR